MAGLLRTRMRGMHQRQRSRTCFCFLSDLHLATRACRAQVLLDLPTTQRRRKRSTRVGDVIDFLAGQARRAPASRPQ